jgi:hypothetical protein
MRVRRLLSWRRDLVVAIAVPVVLKVFSVAAEQLRDRRGPNVAADRLDQAGRVLRKASRFVV